MKVVLLKTNQIKNVHDGYARNYLIPRGLAVPANAETIAKAKKLVAADAQHTQQQESEWKQIQSDLSGATVNVSAQSNEDGTLFGALPESAIIDAVRTQKKHVLQPEWLRIESPIKKTGEHSVRVEFPNKQTVQFTLHVTS